MHEFSQRLKDFKKMPVKAGRIAAFQFVRDIAYGDIGSRDPYDVLNKKKGTCSGKHALLKLFLEGLGYEVQTYFAKHDFGKFPIRPWPEELADFKEKILTDYHDFLKVKIGENRVTVDAIFDADTEKFGFPVADWDGESDMSLPVQADEIFPAEGDPEEHKKRLIAALSERIQKDRKAFLSALTVMLDKKRKDLIH